MSRERNRTVPNLTDTSPAHQKAIADEDDHFRSWQFNVADQYKGMSVEEIKLAIKETANPFAVCMEHLIGDFNFGTVVRNANAFNAKEVFYVGDRKWDRRSAVGVHNYTDVKWLSTIEDFKSLQEKYVIVGIDNVPGSVPLSSYQFVQDTLLVFGEEGVGLTLGMQTLCKDIVEIDMFGSVRSLNCGTASGIAMYEITSQFRKLLRPF